MRNFKLIGILGLVAVSFTLMSFSSSSNEFYGDAILVEHSISSDNPIVGSNGYVQAEARLRTAATQLTLVTQTVTAIRGRKDNFDLSENIIHIKRKKVNSLG